MAEKEYTPADFPPGTVVRHTEYGRQQFPGQKVRRGVVVMVEMNPGLPDWWYVHVRRGKRRTASAYYYKFWEPVLPGDMDADEAAVALANAVLTGDRTAALALADRVAELAGATGV